jgi:NADH-quinone oxidoreductase subunit C
MEEKSDLLSELAARFPADVLETSAPDGDPVAVVRPGALLDIAAALKSGPRDFAMLLDLTCVDFPGRPERFEMIYHLFSLRTKGRLRIKCRLPATEPSVPSLTPLWKNADWLEREVFDMFGVAFEGHPDLRRLFMNEEFEGHPLRKDYPLRKRQPMIPMRNP